MKKSPTTFLCIILVLAGILCACAYAFMLVTINSSQQSSTSMESETQANEALVQNTLKRKNDLKAESDASSTVDVSNLSSYFIKEGEEFTIIEKIEKMCDSVGVTCEINPVGSEGREDLPPQFKILRVMVNTKGQYKSIYNLLSLFENVPYRLFVTQAEFNSSNEATTASSSLPIWTGSFDLDVTTLK